MATAVGAPAGKPESPVTYDEIAKRARASSERAAAIGAEVRLIGEQPTDRGSPLQPMMERSVEDVLAGRLRLKLAGQIHVLPVLSIGENEEWQAGLDDSTRLVLADVDENDLPAMMAAIMGLGPDVLLDAIYSYDKSGVLPADPAFRKSVYPFELLPAVWEVSLAANPTAAWALAAALEEVKRDMAAQAKAARRALNETRPSAPTKASPRRTAGRRAKSGPN